MTSKLQLQIPAAEDDVERLYRCYREALGERDSDIIISTCSKSGTTWMQLILYQLTTSGEMDFDHLFDVSPWVYYSALRGIPPARTPSPRIFKTHDSYHRFVSTVRGRFVFVLRDGKDVAVSWYHHRRDFRAYTGTFSEHFEEFLQGTEYNWFEHVRGWVENLNDLPILYVKYEALKDDRRTEVERVARFCDIGLDETILARTLGRTDFDFMRAHEYRLRPRNDHFAGQTRPRYVVREAGRFIRCGQVGEGERVLGRAQRDAYIRRFDEVLGRLPLVSEYR